MDKEVLNALAYGAWGNYMAIHFLEWLSGARTINSPLDMNIDPKELPRLLEQAKAYEVECATQYTRHLTTD